MPDCGFSLKYKWFLVGLKGGQVGVVWLLVLAWNAWMILAGCLDLFSTRWNVEDDILLRGEIVTPRKEWFSFYVYFCWTSGGAQFLNWKRNKKFCEKLKGQIRSQIRPDLGRIAWGFWKKWVSPLARIRPDCDVSQSVRGYDRLFLSLLILFWPKYLHFFPGSSVPLERKTRKALHFSIFNFYSNLEF